MLPRWLLKLGFHLLYYQLAWTYEWVAYLVSFGQWAEWRRLALRRMQPGPTLELAYGTGVFFADMLRAGHQPVGVDLSPYMARLASRHLRRQGLPVPLCRGRAEQLPCPAARFANVVATFPSDYMLKPETLREIHRVLQPGGQLIIVAEGILQGPPPLRGIINWLYTITNQRSVPPARPLHLIQQHGFAARWETLTHQGATARVLLARKP